MNVLVACEESQRVCISFREKGHNAFSCDIQECSGGRPEWHIMGDVISILNPREEYKIMGQYDYTESIQFQTMDGAIHKVPKWDLIIAHPPCTYLTNSGNGWFNVDRYGEKAIKRIELRQQAAEFFMKFVNADCKKICIENPIGYMSTKYRKPDQIIQPYYFGHSVRKSTCLWLKGLEKLKATEIVDFECIHSAGKSGGYSGYSWIVRDENGKILRYNDPRVAKIRSKTFLGIARAMAEQWG